MVSNASKHMDQRRGAKLACFVGVLLELDLNLGQALGQLLALLVVLLGEAVALLLELAVLSLDLDKQLLAGCLLGELLWRLFNLGLLLFLLLLDSNWGCLDRGCCN